MPRAKHTNLPEQTARLIVGRRDVQMARASTQLEAVPRAAVTETPRTGQVHYRTRRTVGGSKALRVLHGALGGASNHTPVDGAAEATALNRSPLTTKPARRKREPRLSSKRAKSSLLAQEFALTTQDAGVHLAGCQQRSRTNTTIRFAVAATTTCCVFPPSRR